jgi:hypothetical protein
MRPKNQREGTRHECQSSFPILFQRTSLIGTPSGSAKKVHAVSYACRDGDTTIFLSARDDEPHEEALKLLAAAIMTFRKK